LGKIEKGRRRTRAYKLIMVQQKLAGQRKLEARAENRGGERTLPPPHICLTVKV